MMTAFERDAIMAALIDTGGPWDPTTLYIGLAEAINDNGIDTVMADVTEPAGTAGDRQAVTTWTGAHVKTDGAAMVDSPMRTFRPTDYTEATTVSYWYVADAATAGNLVAFGPIAPPISLPDEDYAVSIVLHAIVSPETLRWFEATIMNG